jgi:hypothetical protein
MSANTLKERKLTNVFDIRDVQETSVIKPLTGLKQISDIDQRKYPIVYKNFQTVYEDNTFYEKDDVETALNVLENHGYQPKVFCLSSNENNNSVFEVKSEKWDWIVTPLSSKTINQIPKYFQRGLCILLDNNIRINGVALAKPKLRENRVEVIQEEFQTMLNTFSKIVGFVFILMAIVFKIAAGSIKAFSKSVSASLEKIPDPVLLVKIENKWIEIGRWL